MEIICTTLRDHAFIEPYMVKSVVDALQSMFMFYFSQLHEQKQPFDAQQKTYISSVMLVLLEYMTFGSIFHESLSNSFPTLLFTFICFDKSAFAKSVETLIKDSTPEIKAQVNTAAATLSPIPYDFTEANMQQFLAVFKNFATTCRSLLRKK